MTTKVDDSNPGTPSVAGATVTGEPFSGRTERPGRASDTALRCVHCGEKCPRESPVVDGKAFCCNGCRAVYELLHAADLEEYYTPGEGVGLRPQVTSDRFAILDDPEIQRRLLDFTDGRTARVTYSLPEIHCSSCVWLLEHLPQLQEGITSCRVNFAKQEAALKFVPETISLRQTAELLASLGYAPALRLSHIESNKSDRPDRTLYARLAVAGFCFGNIMLFSFPEYFGLSNEHVFAHRFAWLSLILSLPVLLYSAREFFSSALAGLRHHVLNIDVPVALGILILFLRSAYNIILQGQAGYLDSMTGLVFFLLVGRVYQRRTYQALSFDNDYRGYFPAGVLRLDGERELTVPLDRLKPGDRIRVRNHELIPVDAVVRKGEAQIDYSFVTGESQPIDIPHGEIIFAGGRQKGSALELEVIREPSQSRLLQLWQEAPFHSDGSDHESRLLDRVSRVFTPAIIILAALTATVWMFLEPGRAFDTATAVLIVACPCALALSAPFTLGAVQRVFGRNRFFVKDSRVIERLAHVSDIVFDKTGTVTHNGKTSARFVGQPLTENEKQLVGALVRQSTHPLSVALAGQLPNCSEDINITDLYEEPGQGISGNINGISVRIGSAAWVGKEESSEVRTARVWVAIDDIVRGRFCFENVYRRGIKEVLAQLCRRFNVALLSGDNDSERQNIAVLFGENAEARFDQSPQDKLRYVEAAIASDRSVMMLGDGLNDAGALKGATVGVAVAEDANSFTPACDAILSADAMGKLPRLLSLARSGATIIKVSIGLSLLYNAVGLWYAASGALSPVVAAILMPASSVSVVLLTTAAVGVTARREGLWSPWK